MRENEDLNSVRVPAGLSTENRLSGSPTPGPAPLHPGTLPTGAGKSSHTHNWVWDVNTVVVREGSTRPWTLNQRHKDTATVWEDLSSKKCGPNMAWPQILDCTPHLTLLLLAFYLYTWWVFLTRTDFENSPYEKDPDAEKDWGQEEKETTEDEMVGWYHWLNGHEFEQTLGDGKDREAWHSTVDGVMKSGTWLSDWTTTIQFLSCLQPKDPPDFFVARIRSPLSFELCASFVHPSSKILPMQWFGYNCVCVFYLPSLLCGHLKAGRLILFISASVGYLL